MSSGVLCCAGEAATHQRRLTQQLTAVVRHSGSALSTLEVLIDPATSVHVHARFDCLARHYDTPNASYARSAAVSCACSSACCSMVQSGRSNAHKRPRFPRGVCGVDAAGARFTVFARWQRTGRPAVMVLSSLMHFGCLSTPKPVQLTSSVPQMRPWERALTSQFTCKLARILC